LGAGIQICTLFKNLKLLSPNCFDLIDVHGVVPFPSNLMRVCPVWGKTIQLATGGWLAAKCASTWIAVIRMTLTWGSLATNKCLISFTAI
jgi:hypothetical protein